jgi:hypothetical protein
MDDAPHRTIYRELLNPNAIKGNTVPSSKQLLDEAEVLFSAGFHTVGTVLMTGAHHLLRNPEVKRRLVGELRGAWPALDKPPSYEELEKLPYLASAIIVLVQIPINLGADRRHQGDATNFPRPSCWTSTRCTFIWRYNRRRQHTWRCSSFFPTPDLFRPVDNNTTDGCEPKSPVCPLFRTDLLSAPQVPARTLATAGIESAGMLVGYLLEGPSELSWYQVSTRLNFSVSILSATTHSLAYCELYLALAYLFRHFDVRADQAK